MNPLFQKKKKKKKKKTTASSNFVYVLSFSADLQESLWIGLVSPREKREGKRGRGGEL
jgi:hypothetical protein